MIIQVASESMLMSWFSCINQGTQPSQMSDPLGRQAQKVSELVASDLKGPFTY